MTDRQLWELLEAAKERGASFRVDGGRVIVRAPRFLWTGERAVLEAHKLRVMDLLTSTAEPPPDPVPVRQPVPVPQDERPPEPPVQVYCHFLDRHVREAEVLEMLALDGDDALADYQSGKTPRLDAHLAARNWLRQRWLLQSSERRKARERPRCS